MATKKARSKKHARAPQSATAASLDLLPIAEALTDLAGEVEPLYHLSDLVDRTADLSFNLGWLARSHTLAAIAQFGDEQDRAWALERLKRLVHED
jgi:hypothetical protein